MKFKNKTISILLALMMMLSLCASGYAGEAATPADATPADASAAEKEIPPITFLDTSAIDGKITAYRGIETYFVIYPQPEEAEPRFDVRNTVITFSEEGIVEAHPEKVEQYRFGSINITGIKLGKTVVTVTDPGSGLSCSVEVTVIPPLGYYIRNFFSFLEYLPYLLFMRIVSRFVK